MSFKQEHNRIEGITSTAVPEPKEWYEHVFLIPHEPLRRDMAHAERLLNAADFKAQAWKAAAFFEWYDGYFLPIVHEHHDTEEQLVFPYISERAQLPPKVSEDHMGLMTRMENIAALQGQFEAAVAGGDGDAIDNCADELRKQWSEFSETMREHLAEEERVFPAAINGNFTKAEIDGMIEQINKRNGLSGGRLVLPWILDAMEQWASAEMIEELKSSIPPPVKALLPRWTTDYEFNNRRLLFSLGEDEEPATPTSHCCCCCAYYTFS